MFNIDSKFFIDEKSEKIKKEMISLLPTIYNIVYPSTSLIATDTRIQLNEALEDLKEIMYKNPDLIQKQREKFNQILSTFTKIKEKADKMIKKYQ